MRYTAGQPWLVNALAYEVTWKMTELRDRSITLTPELLEQAKERLVLSRATHLDQLVDKLQEDRVRRVIEPILIGETDNSQKDDQLYCLDLGLIAITSAGLAIANEIYAEVIPRELNEIRQNRFLSVFQPEWINTEQRVVIELKLLTPRDTYEKVKAVALKQTAAYAERCAATEAL